MDSTQTRWRIFEHMGSVGGIRDYFSFVDGTRNTVPNLVPAPIPCPALKEKKICIHTDTYTYMCIHIYICIRLYIYVYVCFVFKQAKKISGKYFFCREPDFGENFRPVPYGKICEDGE